MARTITLTPQTVTITSTKVGSVVSEVRYDPTLSTTLVDGSPITYWEGEYNSGTTTTTCYIHQINDDLVTKYS